MSRFEIKMPKLGESITEGTIISWSVKVGDTVQEDDVLFEVNTAKVSAEIPSPVEGKVIGILFKEGDTVPVGTVVAIVDIDSDEGIGEALVEERNVPQVEETSSHVPSVTSVQEVKEVPKAIAAKTEEERWYSPIVLQLAQAAHISKEELDRIQGTGYEGRLSKKDIKAYITRKEQGNITVTEPVSASAQSVKAVSVRTSPTAPSSASSLTPPVSGSQEGVEVKEMDRVRKMIADHMVMSKHTSPHVTNVVEVDVTKLVKWRDKNKEAFFRREGVKLTRVSVGSVSNVLGGQMTGLTTVQYSGEPGADAAEIFIRGKATWENSSPLIQVDGVDRESMSDIDPNEIESISILKDASATAVFGIRGANGVILITTKRGKEGKAKISFTTSASVLMPTKMVEQASSYDYARFHNQMMS